MQLTVTTFHGVDPAFRRQRMFFNPSLWPFYVSIAVLTALIWVSVIAGIFDLEPMPLLSMGIVAAGFCALGWAARWLTVYRLADLLEAMGLFYASAMLAPLAGAILATSNLPLADHALSRIEPYMFFGFTRDDIVWFFQSSMTGRRVGAFAYNSINWQPIVLMASLFLSGRTRRAWWFLAAWFVALALTLAIFPFVPAISTAAHQGDDWVQVLKQVRSGELRTLSANTLVGIVAFPSFHAAAAILLAWGFSTFGRLGIPLLTLNAIMLLSAVPGGGHYLPDLAAGVGVAIVAVWRVRNWRPRPDIAHPAASEDGS